MKTLLVLLLAILPVLTYLLTEGVIRSKTAGATLWATPVLYLSHTGQAVPQLNALPILTLLFALIRLYLRSFNHKNIRLFHLCAIIVMVSLVLSHSLTIFLLSDIIIVIVSRLTSVRKYYRAPLLLFPVALY